MQLVDGWYPGLGEVETIRRMSPLVREFISDAAVEDPDFVKEYLLPKLGDYDAEERILSDLQDALCDLEFEAAGLGQLGNLGKSFFKRVAKAVRNVHKKIAKVVLPKPLRKVEEKVHKIATKTGKKVTKVAGKIVKKYGNVLITVAGAVLAPFTGGASLAVAALITGANTLRLKRIAANKAKREGKKAADAMLSEVNQQQAQAGQQMDQFYAQNQQWFVDNLGLTPDKWAQLTFDQKVDILQHGMHGTVPSGAPAPTSGSDAGGGYPPPSSGGGGGGTPGGGGGGGESVQGEGAPGSAPKIATASMFDGAMLPVLAGGVALALIFGKSTKGGGRRAKRNPARRYHRRSA